MRTPPNPTVHLPKSNRLINEFWVQIATKRSSICPWVLALCFSLYANDTCIFCKSHLHFFANHTCVSGKYPSRNTKHMFGYLGALTLPDCFTCPVCIHLGGIEHIPCPLLEVRKLALLHHFNFFETCRSSNVEKTERLHPARMVGVYPEHRQWESCLDGCLVGCCCCCWWWWWWWWFKAPFLWLRSIFHVVFFLLAVGLRRHASYIQVEPGKPGAEVSKRKKNYKPRKKCAYRISRKVTLQHHQMLRLLRTRRNLPRMRTAWPTTAMPIPLNCLLHWTSTLLNCHLDTLDCLHFESSHKKNLKRYRKIKYETVNTFYYQ